MATYTRNNETIDGWDYHQGTSAADSVSITNITVVSGGPVTVNDYWEPYTVNGGVMIYDGKDANDTMNAKNLKIEGGLFQFIGGDQNDKLSVNGANVSDGSLKVNGAWDDDSLNVSNVTVSGGLVNVYGDTGTDSVSVSKVSVTGGNFIQRDHGRSNINTASEVTIQGGHFEVSTGILERVGDDPFDADSVVESIGGSNTLSANKISMTGGSLAVYSEGADNSIKVTDVTMTGGYASIRGGVTANVKGEQGNDTISVSNFYVTRPSSYYSEGGEVSILGGGSNNSVSVSNVSVSGYTSNTYNNEGFYISGGVANNTVSVSNLTLDSAGRFYVEDGTSGGGKTSLKDITFSGNSTTSLKAKGDTVSVDGVNFEKSGYVSLSGNGNISAQNIINTVGGGITMTGGENSADEISLEKVTISSSNISINGNGGADNFTVDNVSMTGGNIYVIGGKGNANVSVTNIDKTGGYVDIDMGGHDSVTSGNDTIFVENISNAYRAYFDIYARGGNDSISIKNSTNEGYLRAYGGAGKDTITAENISVSGSYGYFSIVGGADDDLISVKGSTNAWAYGDEGNDTIIASESHVGIDAGAGNDSVSVTKIIENSAANFDCGEGNDTIEFYETWMPYYDSYTGTGGRVSGDAGDDLLIARNATIYGTGFFGGEGNDTISVDNSTVTSGFRFYNGAGNDSVSVSNITGNFSGDVMFYSEYSTYASDGNDTISLDNWTLTGDDSQRILINGSIFSVDNSSINGADSISIKNIIAPNATFYVYGKGGNDTVSFENMTLGGLGISYGDTMVRNGNIYGNFDSGNDSVSVSNIEFYKGSSSYVSLNGGEGADTISVDDVTLGDENDGRYTQAHLTVTGGAGADVINVSNVTVTGSYSSGYILGEDGADKISVTDSDGLQITGGDGNDTLYFGGALNATLTDIAAGDVVSLSGDYKKAYYKDGVLIYGTGVKVSLSGVSDVADISNVTIYNGKTKTNVKNFVTALEWKIENGVASYGDLISIGGLSSSASWSDITVDGKAINTLDDEEILATGKPVVIAATALDTSTTVTITSGYTLKLADDVTVPESVPAHWEISKGTANYFATGSTGGYILSNNEIYYKAADSGEAQISINGLNTAATEADISVNKKVVTISAHALAQADTVEINDGYTLKLDTDVTISETTPAGWSVASGTAEYKTENVTAGYTLSDNKISYNSATAAQTLVTVNGLKTSAKATQLSLDENTVTVAQAAVNKGALTISDGYALNLAKGTYTGVSVVGSSNADTITQTGNSAVISVGAGDDLISLASGTSKNTIIGGAGNDSISATKGKNLFQYASGDGNDTISGFSATDTLQITSGEIDSWTIDDKDLTLKVGSGSIKIANGAGASINVIDSGSTKAATYIYGENLKYNTKKTAVTLAADYTNAYTAEKAILTIDGAAKTSIQITGNDKANLIIGGENSTLWGGKGNDTLTGGDGADVFVYSAGKDVITNYAEGDKISIGSSITSVSVKSSKSAADVIFKVGSNTLTVKDGGGKKITVNDSTYIYESGKIYDEDKTAVTLTAAFKGTLDSGVVTADGSTVASALNITGNTENNSIIGGTKNDTLNGGAGNDTLTGGKGNDTFVFSGGNDVITDYEAADKISLTSAITNTSVDEGDVIFETANGKLTVTGGEGKKITTVVNKKSAVQIYYDGLTYNEKQTAVTLDSGYSANYTETVSSVVSIDGSSADSIQITGNAKNNLIIGSDDGNTLWGGKGNDTLTGGDGADVFIYSAGKDVITNYAEEDKISIGGAIKSVSVKSSDVIFKVGSNSLTAKNAAGKKVTVNDTVYIYESGKTYNEDKTAVTLTSGFKGTVESGVVTVDGSAVASALNVTGNDSNNVIYGGTKGDSLNGGAGNDTLTGGNGNDTFIASSGNDVITDYAAGKDKIKFSGDFSWNISGDDVVFSTDEGTLTVKDGAGKKITTLDSQNKSDTQIYSNSNARTADLFEDNNFISDAVQISDITEITADNYSVTEIKPSTYENLAQAETVLTYCQNRN